MNGSRAASSRTARRSALNLSPGKSRQIWLGWPVQPAPTGCRRKTVEQSVVSRRFLSESEFVQGGFSATELPSDE